MRLTFQHTLTDLLEVNCTAREERLKGWLIALVGAAHVLLGVWVVFFWGNQPDATPVFLAGGAFLGLGAVATRLAGFGTWLLKSRRVPFELEVGPSGIAFVEADGLRRVGWELFSRWYETPNLIVLVSGGDSLAIPRRSCGEAEWVALLGWVCGGIGQPARW
jgi:hypothetical protein